MLSCIFHNAASNKRGEKYAYQNSFAWMNSTKQTHYYYVCAFAGNEQANTVVVIKHVNYEYYNVIVMAYAPRIWIFLKLSPT